MNKNEIIENHYRLNYKKLVQTYTRRVPNFSKHLAEEVVQEAYARALFYWSTFDKSNFDKWFNGILRNASKDCRTNEGNKGTVREYDENDLVQVTGDDYKQMHRILAEVYKTQDTSLRDWNVLNMFYVHGFTSKDISAFMNLTHTNTRQIIYKFKQRINEDLD